MKIVDGRSCLEEIRGLILEYAEMLGEDLTFQNFSEELEHLKEKYTGENGRLLAAVSADGQVVGCVAYRRHNARRCEIKRLYVNPQYRGSGIGDVLVAAVLELAAADGYTEMVLDTLKRLEGAVHLYRKYGFREISPYYDNPLDDVIYMKKDLRGYRKEDILT